MVSNAKPAADVPLPGYAQTALYEDADGDLYLDLGGQGSNGERLMRRFANDDRDWVTAEEFGLLTPFHITPPKFNAQEKS